MAHRRGGFRQSGISQSQRRKKTWAMFSEQSDPALQQGNETISLDIDMTAPVSGADAVSAFVAFTGADFIPAESTILRMRGSLSLTKSQPSAGGALSQGQFAFGIGVANTALLQGGAIPNPAKDPFWDGWMFYRSTPLDTVEANAGVVDIKSMRKIESGTSLFCAFGAEYLSTDGFSAAADVVGSAVFSLRFLILLP